MSVIRDRNLGVLEGRLPARVHLWNTRLDSNLSTEQEAE